jgi:hypothetical protein
VLNVRENDAPPVLSPEAVPSPKVTLCADAPELHVHVTVAPTATCALMGENVLSLTLTEFVWTGADPPVWVPPDVPPVGPLTDA